MLEWLLNAELWKQIAGVATTVLGLVTAVVALKKTRSPASTSDGPRSGSAVVDLRPAAAARLRLVSLEGEPAVPCSPLWLKAAVVVFGILGVLMTALSVFTFVQEPSFLSLLPAFFFAGCTVSYVVAAKRLWGDPQQGSPVKREGTFNILGEYDQLWDGCVAALRRMKVEIKTIDAKKGVIEGETAWSWKSFGEILVIQITKAGPDEYSVHVKSDSIIVTTAFDFGKNASNIRRFVQELVP